MNPKNDGFLQFSRNQAETKKVVGVKVVSFGVLYSRVKFRRLKMGDPVYNRGKVLESAQEISSCFVLWEP